MTDLIFGPAGCPEPARFASSSLTALLNSLMVREAVFLRGEPPTGRSLLAPPLVDDSSLALRLTPGLLSPRSALAVEPAEERQEQQGQSR